MTDIYLNVQKVKEVLERAEEREARFEKSRMQSRKSYGNKIFKERHNEYFKQEKATKYETAYLRLRGKHRSL